MVGPELYQIATVRGIIDFDEILIVGFVAAVTVWTLLMVREYRRGRRRRARQGFQVGLAARESGRAEGEATGRSD